MHTKEKDIETQICQIGCRICKDRVLIEVDKNDYKNYKMINFEGICKDCMVEGLKGLLDEAILIKYKEDEVALKMAIDLIENDSFIQYSIGEYKDALKQLNSLLMFWIKSYKLEKDYEIKNIFKRESLALVFIINDMYAYSKNICGEEDKLWKTEISLWNKRKLGTLQFL